MRRFEFERQFGDLFAQVASLFLEDDGVFSFEAIDRTLVELSDLLQRGSRFSAKSLEVDAMLGLENWWSAQVKVRKSKNIHIGLLERFLQPLFVFFLDNLDLGSEDLFLALSHWSAIVKQQCNQPASYLEFIINPLQLSVERIQSHLLRLF